MGVKGAMYNHYNAKHVRRQQKTKKKNLFVRNIIRVAICLFITAAVFFTMNLFGKYTNLFSTNNTFTKSGVSSNNQIKLSSEKNHSDWKLLLVNRANPLPENYKFNLIALANGEQVDERIYPDLQKMFDDMRAEGIYPMVVSGYRTSERQQQIMDEKIQEYILSGYSNADAKAKAEEWVALPGTSEHQLGLAIDINADIAYSTGDSVYEWLLQNSYKYGFIKRYAEDKKNITGVINEPWHYRYVGKAAATEIVNKGVCLEEYLGATN